MEHEMNIDQSIKQLSPTINIIGNSGPVYAPIRIVAAQKKESRWKKWVLAAATIASLLKELIGMYVP